MQSILYKSSLNYLKRNFLQSLFVIVGISLGIAVTFAIDIAIDSAQRSFALSTKRVTGAATHSIYSVDAKDLDQGVFLRLKNELGLINTAPVIEAFVPVFKSSFQNSANLEEEISLTQNNKDRDLVKILGVDPLSESKFREIQIAANSNNKIFSKEPGVFCTKETADGLGVEVGDYLRLRVASEIKKVKLEALLESRSDNYKNLFLMDLSQAQKLLAKQGVLSKIDLKANDEGLFETVFGTKLSLDDLKETLADHVSIKSSETKSKSLEQMTKSFNVNLQALSFLAVIVAAFLIYNSVSFSVVQRRKIFSILRTIGVSRREIVKQVVFEAGIFAFLGIGLGVLVGFFFADLLVSLVLQTINDIYFSLEVGVKKVSFLSVSKSVLLGLATCFVAALIPALDASSSNPIMSMSRTSFENKSKLQSLFFVILSVVFAACAFLVLKIRFTTDFLPIIFNDINLGFLSLLFILLAFTFLIPVSIQILTFIFEPLYAVVLGFIGSFSVKSITRQLSRTSVAISALTIALSMTLALNITVSSFRKTVESWLEQSLRADVYISVPRLVSNQAQEVLPDDLYDEIDNNFKAEVKEILTYTMLSADSNYGSIQVAALEDKESAFDLMKFRETQSGFWQRMSNLENLIIVSEPFTYKHNLKLGDKVEIKTKLGAKNYTIAAVFEDFGSEHGIVMMTRTLFKRDFQTNDVNSIGVILKEHNSLEAINRFIAGLKEKLFKKHLLFIRSNYSLKKESLDIFDRTFQVTNVLKFIALTVAFIAILSSFMSLQLERIKEFSILRATGTSPWQIAKLLTVQTLTMGFFSFLFAIPAGVIQAYVMIFIINKRSFGWSLDWNLDPNFYLEVLLLSLGASLLSVVYPIYYTNKQNLSESLRND